MWTHFSLSSLCGIILCRKVDIMYTDEQITIIAQNPYTHSITKNHVSFTLEFKKFFAKQMNVPGMTTPKIFRLAGYDPDMFSQSSKDHLRIKIRKELASEEGLQPPKGLSREEKLAAFAEKDLSKQRTDTSIKELQDRVVYLEKQIEFLKKISALENRP